VVLFKKKESVHAEVGFEAGCFALQSAVETHKSGW
jgi:hypothetical protein